MPRELTQDEIAAFLSRVPQAAADVATHTELDKGVYSQTGNIPQYGRAYKDTSGSYVLVWVDASYRFHFIDLADMPSFAAEVNKPPYVSPSAGVFDDITSQVSSGVSGVVNKVTDLFGTLRDEINKVESDSRNIIFLAIVGVVIIAVVIGWRGVEAPGLKIG